MKLKNIGYVRLSPLRPPLSDRLGRTSEAKSKKMMAPPPQPARAGRSRCAAQGGMKFTYANACCGKGRRPVSRKAAGKKAEAQEDGKKKGQAEDEEEDVAVAIDAKKRAAAAAARFDGAYVYFLRGGICSSSAICSLVSGFSRNLSFTASRIAPSRSANLSVCNASFGWNLGHQLLEQFDRPVDFLGIHLDRLRIGIHPVHRLAIGRP